MNGTDARYTEEELRRGLTGKAAGGDFDPWLGGLADQAVAGGRRLVRRRRATTVAVGLAAVAVAASAVAYARPGGGGGNGGGPAVPPVVGADTLGATAMVAFQATCFDGPVAQPSLKSYYWDSPSQRYVWAATGPTVHLAPDGKSALFDTGVTMDGTTSYAVGPSTGGRFTLPTSAAYRTFPSSVALAWSTDSKALINVAAMDAGTQEVSVDFYDPATFAKRTVPLPAEVLALTEPARAGGAWRITGLTGTSSDLAITVMAPDHKQVRVYDEGGGSSVSITLRDVPGRIVADGQFTTVFSPDGRFLLLRGSADIAVFDLDSGGRLVFRTQRGAVPVGAKPDDRDFVFLGWTPDDQLFGVLQWSATGRQDVGVHQRIELLTPLGKQVASEEYAIPGDKNGICTLFSAINGPADAFPGAPKL